GAIGWVKYGDGTLPAWWAKIHQPPPNPAPAVVKPPPVALPSSDSQGPRNIFTDSGSSTTTDSPSPNVSNPAPHPAPITEMPVSPSPPAVPAPVVLSVVDARAKLDAAMSAVEQSLASDPAYIAAKKTVDEAEAKRKAAVAASGAGSDQVLAAGNEWLNAKAQLK